jgi:hypothetical protein
MKTRPLEKRVCEGPDCEKLFTPGTANQIYCSRRCARRAARRRPKYEPHIARCDHCGEQYLKTHPSRKYCSPECVREAKLKPWPVVKCRTCGREFRTSPGFKSYCSRECRPPHLRRLLDRRRSERPKQRFVCPYCGAEVRRTRRDQRTCGAAECMAAAARDAGSALPADYELSAREREMLGLPAPKPGFTVCLRCDAKFRSPDVRRFRLCPKCSGTVRSLRRHHHFPDDMRGSAAGPR